MIMTASVEPAVIAATREPVLGVVASPPGFASEKPKIIVIIPPLI